MTPFHFLQTKTMETFVKNEKVCIWKNAPFEYFSKLKNDHCGKVGELLVENICKESDIPHIYTGDINSKDGTYDIMILGKKVEIKTARLGASGTFQHECIRKEGYDYLMFIDVLPNYLYMTIVPKCDLTTKDNPLFAKAHLRKGSTDIYKIDFNEKKIIQKLNSIKIVPEMHYESIEAFILKNILNDEGSSQVVS